ncbi:14177_t:CDS:1, partial [Cetraspora pellucida]
EALIKIQKFDASNGAIQLSFDIHSAHHSSNIWLNIRRLLVE